MAMHSQNVVTPYQKKHKLLLFRGTIYLMQSESIVSVTMLMNKHMFALLLLFMKKKHDLFDGIVFEKQNL